MPQKVAWVSQLTLIEEPPLDDPAVGTLYGKPFDLES